MWGLWNDRLLTAGLLAQLMAELLRELIADALRKKGELERIATRLRRVPQ
jgi:hypothetical protein